MARRHGDIRQRQTGPRFHRISIPGATFSGRHSRVVSKRRILAAHHAFLDAWDEGHVLGTEALKQAAGTELDETAGAQWLDEVPTPWYDRATAPRTEQWPAAEQRCSF